VIVVLCTPLAARALDYLSISRAGATLHLQGRVLAQTAGGETALLTPDNLLWIAQGDEILARRRDDAPLAPLDRDALAARLLAELPPGFRVHKTAHYVICYNTTSAYAEWCGALYERLYRGFFSFWKHQGLELTQPEWPLAALVFDDRASYARYSQAELGDATTAIIGYYSLHTNRVTMYDLTGADGLADPRASTSAAHINQILSQPAAERTVATIVHEATHQLVYNSGLQQRYAGVPLWLSEGLAVYFETPDLGSTKAWREIGAVNRVSLANFTQSLEGRGGDSLLNLLRDDARLRDPRQAAAAYGEAWALTSYLLRNRREDFVAYLQTLARLGPLESLSPDERVAQFKACFGHDLKSLDADLLRQTQRLR
jgi:hypothetical protein